MFISEGNISLVIKSKCQKCFKSTLVKLDIDLNVGIKDKKYEAKDKKGPLDIHYQNLNLYDLEKLIAEEIHLNFPSIIVCCNKEKEQDEQEMSIESGTPDLENQTNESDQDGQEIEIEDKTKSD